MTPRRGTGAAPAARAGAAAGTRPPGSATPGRVPLSPQVLGSLFIVAGGVFAGVLGPLARILYDAGMTPLAFIVWRGLAAGAALWLIVLWRRRRGAADGPGGYGFAFARLDRRERLALIGFAASNVLLNTSLFIAFDRVPIAIALLAFYTYPALLAVYGRLTRTEAMGPLKIAALVLALVGLVLVVATQFDPSAAVVLDPVGLGLAFVASLSAAAWIGFGRACPSVPAEQAMGVALTATVAVIGVVALAAGQIDALRHPLEQPGSLALVVFTGVLSGAAAAVLFTLGIRLISRVRAGILGLVEPIVGVVTAALILGEVLSPVQLLGGALVLAAAVLIQRASDGAAPAAPRPAREAAVSTAE